MLHGQFLLLKIPLAGALVGNSARETIQVGCTQNTFLYTYLVLIVKKYV